MAVLLSGKALFYCVPKTACSAISGYLISNCAGQWVPPNDIFNGAQRPQVEMKHTTPAQLRYYLNGDPPTAVRFCVTRNPYDWVASVYFYARHSFNAASNGTRVWWVDANPDFYKDSIRGSFREFVGKHFSKPGKSVCARWAIDCDLVLKYEQLPGNLIALLESLGFETDQPLPSVNVTPGRPNDLLSVYDEESAQLVARAFEDDFVRFSYSHLQHEAALDA